MQFENSNGKNESTARVPDGYDYSHLAARSVHQHDEQPNAAQFGRMLTDYDLVLLRFGMHISWQD
jgi:hypothetical protein